MATLLLLCFFISSTSTAFGANFCSDAIVDETGKLSGQDLSRITSAINQLASTNVDVRIRFLSNFHGHTTLEDARGIQEQSAHQV